MKESSDLSEEKAINSHSGDGSINHITADDSTVGKADHKIGNQGGCSVYGYIPEGETMEDCRSRISTTVTRQQAYCSDAIPAWLHADFLYKINYGPATWSEIYTCLKELQTATETSKRFSLTLLDRRISAMLAATIFAIPFESTEPDLENRDQAGDTSPYDYDKYKMETRLWIDCEEFVMRCVWDIDYSSAIFGPQSRPPMAAVALDMVKMVEYLSKISDEPSGSRSIADLLLEFYKSGQLRSIRMRDINEKWVVQGYLSDMFQIVIQIREPFPHFMAHSNGFDKNQPAETRHRTPFARRIPSWAETTTFPGGRCLGILDEEPLSEGAWRSLDDFDASFICSGPFNLGLTNTLSEHLTLGSKRDIRIFWDGERVPFPGATFFPFEFHALGRSLKADRLAQEIQATYSLLFSRNSTSQRIVRNLFKPLRFRVEFCNHIDTEIRFDNAGVMSVGSLRRPDIPTLLIENWHKKGENIRHPTLADFHIFQSRLNFLKSQMDEWRPQGLGDLFIPAYRDRFVWWTTFFVLAIGALGVIQVATSVAQTVVGYQNLSIARHMLIQQLNATTP